MKPALAQSKTKSKLRQECLKCIETHGHRMNCEKICVEVDWCNTVSDALESQIKVEKYKGHDLQKAPNDLPPPEHEVDVVCWTGRGNIRTHAIYEDGTVPVGDSGFVWENPWDDCELDEDADGYVVPQGWYEYKYYGDTEYQINMIDDVVIAWREIEPFETDTDGVSKEEK